MQDIQLGPYTISDTGKPVFIAEIGALFNQDMALAFELIDAVASARDQVPSMPLLLKGEILNDPSVCLDDDTIETYQSKTGERKVERYRDLIERKALPLETYAKIFLRCRERGLHALMSVYTREGAEFAAAEGVVALKIASGNITHLPLIRHAARQRLPMLIDTGRATLGEVDAAVRMARKEGNGEVLIEHSPDGHPAPPENHNMLSIETLRRTFDTHVGLSCHSSGTDMLIMAVALGAKLLEKNVVKDETRLEQDYAIAANISELPDMLSRVETAWASLGRPFRDPARKTGLISTTSRSCLVARRELAAGEAISEASVAFAFPCKGVPVEFFDDVSGWKLRRTVAAGKPIGWGDIEP
jgi:sialic acid synthase SpsE